ncbi:GNAT family N-acetyltransferase [Streptomyces sp. NPDC057621]|uniref:GNAT family N-acetyltransferase n=1 Tax=Streptomyces sp. NPDC057621 TaxID=3346186 RepID=UPI0036A9E50E
MPPPDASTDADAATAPRAGARSGSVPAAGSPDRPDAVGGPGNADTLDLRLPDEFLALFAADPEAAGTAGAAGTATTAGTVGTADGEQNTGEPVGGEQGPGEQDSGEQHGRREHPAPRGTRPARPLALADEDLLDRVGGWGQTATAVGAFHLVPVHLTRDVPLISRWMNDPAVAAFWELAGPDTATEEHLRAQLDGDGRSVPCLGVLNGTPMSYWEIYRADLDPLARHYPARPHDTGIHLLIGGVAHRGRGLGTVLLRAVSDLVLDRRPSCARVVAEPDLRNTPSVSAFLSAGFRFSAEVELPDKKAALMVRDRALRDLL